MSAAAFAAAGILAALGMYGAAGWVGARYDAEESAEPPWGQPTEPWEVPQ